MDENHQQVRLAYTEAQGLRKRSDGCHRSYGDEYRNIALTKKPVPPYIGTQCDSIFDSSTLPDSSIYSSVIGFYDLPAKHIVTPHTHNYAIISAFTNSAAQTAEYSGPGYL